MPSRFAFFKYCATGNDFILIDNRERFFLGNEINLFHDLCARKTGVGADGVLLLEASGRDDCAFTMRYFNCDGRESEMCGNGARASAYHAATHGMALPVMRFVVSGEVYEARVQENRVQLLMQSPRDLRLTPGALASLPSLRYDEITEGGFVNTGVPHYVLFAGAVDAIAVATLGKTLRHHEAFAPAGTNVNFVEVAGRASLKLRTYERGVEEETLACGTGAVACAHIAHLTRGVAYPMTLVTSGGELRVSLDVATNRPVLEGAVKLVFTGETSRDTP